MSQPLIIRILSASVAAANRAGELIREVLRRGNLGLVQKGYDDPQTEADRKSQRCIVGSLTTRFPGLTVVGEENLDASEEDRLLICTGDDEEVLREACPNNLAALQEKEVVVWVDPLDGTKEFSEGVTEYVTVLVGIAVRGVPVGGVIHQPFWRPVGTPQSQPPVGRTVWGLVGGSGVKGLQLPDTPPSSSSPARGLTAVVTLSHYCNLTDMSVKSVSPSTLLRAGGAGYKMLMVIEGRADVYFNPSAGTKKWDTCAGDAILRALRPSPGILTDLAGNPLVYTSEKSNYKNRGFVVTLNEGVHSEVMSKLPEAVKSSLNPMAV